MQIKITNLGWCIIGTTLAIINIFWVDSTFLAFIWGLCFGQIFLNLKRAKKEERK
jgi:hypothetical protein